MPRPGNSAGSGRFRGETYHKGVKSGCRAEWSQPRTAERLTNLLAVLCMIAWRVSWLTMTSRATAEDPSEVALTRAEVEILDRLAGGEPASRRCPTTSLRSPGWVGRLTRVKDPPPGNMVFWRGLTRLMEIHLGFELSGRIVGN